MSAPTCPACNAHLSATDLKDGWCDACGKKLPGSLVAGLKPGAGYWASVSRSRFVIASLGARLSGFLADGVITVLAYVPGLLLLFSNGGPDPQTHSDTILLLGLGVLIGCVSLLSVVQIVLLSLRGQTLGKMYAGTRIVRQSDGSNPGFVGAVLMRAVLPGLIVSIPGVGSIFGIVDLCYIFSDNHRRLVDRMAGTVVVEA
jgi:uncharacterized RDD family membrane protein YckC